MEFKDVLANDEVMAGKWQTGSPPPPGDFRTVMETIQKVLPPGIEESLANNTYSRVFWGLSQAYYKQWLNQTFKTAAGMFVAVNSSPLRLSSERVIEIGGWVELITVQWQGYAFGSDKGLDISDGFLNDNEAVSFKSLAGMTNQNELLQKITQAIAGFDKLPRYSKQGVVLLLLDMMWWGYSCFYNNGDTIGEGDQEFFAYYSASSLKTHEYYLEHPEEKPNFNTRLSFEFYVIGVNLDFPQLPEENPEPDTTDTSFPLLIDLEFIGYSKDLVGLQEYGPNRRNDVFLLATVDSTTNVRNRYTLTDVGLDSDEIEERIWATKADANNDSPLGICTVVKDSAGNYLPGKLINKKDNDLSLSLEQGATFGIVIDVGAITPKTGSSTDLTTFNCYFQFENKPEDIFIETKSFIPTSNP
jgi:hypothetical protein